MQSKRNVKRAGNDWADTEAKEAVKQTLDALDLTQADGMLRKANRVLAVMRAVLPLWPPLPRDMRRVRKGPRAQQKKKTSRSRPPVAARMLAVLAVSVLRQGQGEVPAGAHPAVPPRCLRAPAGPRDGTWACAGTVSLQR